MDLDDLLDRLKDGPAQRHRLMQTIEDASIAAREDTYGFIDPDGTVRLAMDGRYRIQGMGIDPEAYDQMDTDGLSERVMTTYNLARQAVHTKQLERVLNPFSGETGSDKR